MAQTTRKEKQQASRQLPSFITPMLPRLGEPFDSEEHLFELKWDGMRLLIFVEHGTYRLVSRRRLDCTHLYPELDFLAELPSGTLLDAELIVMRDGRPDFFQLMSRERMTNPRTIRSAAASTPATIVAFDMLYCAFRSVMDETLLSRRDRLHEALNACCGPRLAISEVIPEHGKRLFEEVLNRDLEGVVAKRAASRYLPGKRGWIKFKRRRRMPCVVIGYVPEGRTDFHSLVIATNGPVGLEVVGHVEVGFTAEMRDRMNALLRANLRVKPAVPCRERAIWVEPSIFCWVTYMERTHHGHLRAPAFDGLIA